MTESQSCSVELCSYHKVETLSKKVMMTCSTSMKVVYNLKVMTSWKISKHQYETVESGGTSSYRTFKSCSESGVVVSLHQAVAWLRVGRHQVVIIYWLLTAHVLPSTILNQVFSRSPRWNKNQAENALQLKTSNFNAFCVKHHQPA